MHVSSCINIKISKDLAVYICHTLKLSDIVIVNHTLQSNNAIEETRQNVRKLNRRVQEAVSGLQKQMNEQQNQTQHKLEEMEGQQIAMKNMLTVVIKEFQELKSSD